MGKNVKKAAVSIPKNSTAKKAVKKPAAPIKPAAKKIVSAPAKATAKPAGKKPAASSVKKTAVPAPALKTAGKKPIAPPVRKPVPAAARTAALPPRKSLSAKAVKKGSARRPVKEEPLRKLKLSKAEKKFFYELLMGVRASFGEQIKFHSDEVLSAHKDSAGERAGMATHMADLGTDNFRHDFELGLMSEEVDVLEMVDEALQRLEDSEYGICLDCGELIPKARLEAKPYAKFCTKCKSKREEMDDSFTHRR